MAWVSSLFDQLLHLRSAGVVAGLAVLLFLLLEFPQQRRYAQILFLALLAIGLIGVAAASEPLALFLAD
jgi:uncharacterized membrane protein